MLATVSLVVVVYNFVQRFLITLFLILLRRVGTTGGTIRMTNSLVTDCSFTSESTVKRGEGLYVETECFAVVSATVFRDNDKGPIVGTQGRDLYLRNATKVVLINTDSKTANGKTVDRSTSERPTAQEDVCLWLLTFVPDQVRRSPSQGPLTR